MSAIEIIQVTDKKGIKAFVDFNHRLYHNCPYIAPEIREDMLYTLDPHQNDAFEFCDCACYLARRDGKTVGRVAAIINRKANAKWNVRVVRFGWIDFIDDIEVARSLLEQVEAFGRRHGMTVMQGPLGFTDFDPEGTLIEGFEELDAMGTLYNYDYYPRLFEQLGLTKAVDWVEQIIKMPTHIPEKHLRVAKLISQRYNLTVRSLRDRHDVKEFGPKIFGLLNQAYSKLFGYSEMSPKQAAHYIKEYLPSIDLNMVCIIQEAATGELVGTAISMPSMTRALQRARGRLLPFGWIHVLDALHWHRPDIVDLMLIGIRPDHQNRGLNALLFTHLIPIYQQMGFKYAVVYPQLETNSRGVGLWDDLEPRTHRRRRCYTKPI